MITSFHTPIGRAGSDQVDAMEESVNAHLEQMFLQRVKQDLLFFGVGRTTMRDDNVRRLDAQRRECEGQMVFHAGRALELSMQIIYARGSDRIIGREFPGVDKKILREDLKSHDLLALYTRIIDLGMSDLDKAFEDKYQHAVHRGIVSIYDGRQTLDIWTQDQRPFTERSTGNLADGEEYTMDHVDFRDLFMRPDGTSDFAKMSERTFEEFLKKADSVYYERDVAKKRRNMRWGGYSSRDHEVGRSYVVVGVYFFARLVHGIIELSGQPWTWHKDYLKRRIEREHHSVMKRMRTLAEYALKSEVAWPDQISIEELMELRCAKGTFPATGKGKYDHLHTKIDLSKLNAYRDSEDE